MTLSYLVYQLAKNPGVQQKLQEEVDQAYEESQGEITFLPVFFKEISLTFLSFINYFFMLVRCNALGCDHIDVWPGTPYSLAWLVAGCSTLGGGSFRGRPRTA